MFEPLDAIPFVPGVIAAALAWAGFTIILRRENRVTRIPEPRYRRRNPRP